MLTPCSSSRVRASYQMSSSRFCSPSDDSLTRSTPDSPQEIDKFDDGPGRVAENGEKGVRVVAPTDEAA